MINIEQLFLEEFDKSDYDFSENPILSWDVLKTIPDDQKEDAILSFGLDKLMWKGSGSKPTLADLKSLKSNVEQTLKSKSDAAQIYDTALSDGFDTGLGFKLSISDSAYLTVNAYAAWVDRVVAAKEEAKYLPLGIFLIDQKNNPHTVSHDELTALLLPYGAVCTQAYILKVKP